MCICFNWYVCICCSICNCICANICKYICISICYCIFISAFAIVFLPTFVFVSAFAVVLRGRGDMRPFCAVYSFQRFLQYLQLYLWQYVLLYWYLLLYFYNSFCSCTERKGWYEAVSLSKVRNWGGEVPSPAEQSLRKFFFRFVSVFLLLPNWKFKYDSFYS